MLLFSEDLYHSNRKVTETRQTVSSGLHHSVSSVVSSPHFHIVLWVLTEVILYLSGEMFHSQEVLLAQGR